MSLFTSWSAGTTIADIGIAHQDALVLALTLELGQPRAVGQRQVLWSELGGLFGAYAEVKHDLPDGFVWDWPSAMLVRWVPIAVPVADGAVEVLRLIVRGRDPAARALVARMVAAFPGRKRAAGRSNRPARGTQP